MCPTLDGSCLCMHLGVWSTAFDPRNVAPFYYQRLIFIIGPHLNEYFAPRCADRLARALKFDVGQVANESCSVQIKY